VEAIDDLLIVRGHKLGEGNFMQDHLGQKFRKTG